MATATERGQERQRFIHRLRPGQTVPIAVRIHNRNRVHKVQRVTHEGVLVFHPRCNVDYAELVTPLDADQLRAIGQARRCQYRWCFGDSRGVGW